MWLIDGTCAVSQLLVSICTDLHVLSHASTGFAKLGGLYSHKPACKYYSIFTILTVIVINVTVILQTH